MRLKRQHEVIDALLDDHGNAFTAPAENAYAVDPVGQLAP
jgi:hypothetical protein